MHIAICDDEEQIQKQIRELVIKQMPDCVTEVFASGEELLESQVLYDILFLDIQMEGMDGIETAKEIRKRDKESVLIFITGIREYVFEAFDVSALHYLVKPISEKRFADVFKRAADHVKRRDQAQAKRLLIRSRKRKMTIFTKDIYYIESQRRKVGIHTVKEVIEIYATMNELEEQVGDSFFRCHRGYIVNMAYIAEYGSDFIQLCTGEDIYLSKEKYPDFVKAYMHYLRKGGVSCV